MNAHSGILWIASFPKSGNTWFRIFLANLVAGANGPADINNLAEVGGISSNRHEFEAATLLDSSLISHDEIDRLRPRVYEWIAAAATEQRWIKVHDAYTLTPDGEPMFGTCATCAAIYLVRDPRDVVVSLAYYSNTTVDDTIELINSIGYGVCYGRNGMKSQLRQKMHDWSRHVTSWLDQTDVPVHVLRYEDLVADPFACFCAALRFAERRATDAEIERAIRYSHFTELQRQESEKGFAENSSRTSLFFRSGRASGWRDELSADQVARIEEAHAPTMRRLGYELSGVRKSATACDHRTAL
jgi:sulfotransferase family protein